VSSPQRVDKLRGRVAVGQYGKGSKSERMAVFIDTERGRYLLRRKGGSTFAVDELSGFAGALVECDGFLLETTLLAERIQRVE
jgi:hypothetical protein